MEIDLWSSFRVKSAGNLEERSLDLNLEARISLRMCVCCVFFPFYFFFFTLSLTVHHVPPRAFASSSPSVCSIHCSSPTSLPFYLHLFLLFLRVSAETFPDHCFDIIPSPTPCLPLWPLPVLLPHILLSDSLHPSPPTQTQTVPLLHNCRLQEGRDFYVTPDDNPKAWHTVVQVPSHVRLFCDPVDCSPSVSSVYGLPQARILEWVTISFSRGSSWPKDWTCISCIGRQILYHWATREVRHIVSTQ